MKCRALRVLHIACCFGLLAYSFCCFCLSEHCCLICHTHRLAVTTYTGEQWVHVMPLILFNLPFAAALFSVVLAVDTQRLSLSINAHSLSISLICFAHMLGSRTTRTFHLVLQCIPVYHCRPGAAGAVKEEKKKEKLSICVCLYVITTTTTTFAASLFNYVK